MFDVSHRLREEKKLETNQTRLTSVTRKQEI